MTFQNKALLLSISTTILFWIAWPPHHFLAPLLWGAFVPLLWAIDLVLFSPQANKLKRIFVHTFIAFFVLNIASTYWVYNAVRVGTGNVIGIFVSLIPWVVESLLMTIPVAIYAFVRLRWSRLSSYWVLISAWLLCEALNTYWDLAFPWMNLGNGFATISPLVQWYEYTGTIGGCLWILVSNILLLETLRYQKTKKTKIYFSAALFLWIAIPSVISLKRYFSFEESENPCNVVVVQPNIDPYNKYSTSNFVQINDMIRLSKSVAQVNTEFFIWPETAIADYIDEENIRNYPSYKQVRDFLYNYPNANLLSGIESYKLFAQAPNDMANFRPEVGKYIENYNAATLIDNSDKVQFYHKSWLVPGVEQIPFAKVFPFFKTVFKHLGGAVGSYGKQSDPSVFYSQSGIGVAPIICYESIWGNYVAQFINKEAQFIAIVTNDGWWGDTPGKDQHLYYAKLRAIENRRWVARSANTGISAFINQRGDIVQQTTWWKPAAIKQDINLSTDLTFYTKHGNWLFHIVWLCIIASVFFRNRQKLIE